MDPAKTDSFDRRTSFGVKQEIDPEHAEVLRMMFLSYIESALGYAASEHRLNQLG